MRIYDYMNRENDNSYKHNFVYGLTHKIEKWMYIGTKSSDETPVDVIGKTYFTSSDYVFDEFKYDSNMFEITIIQDFESRSNAIILESALHKQFDVKNNPYFMNKMNQTLSGFDTSGWITPTKACNYCQKEIGGGNLKRHEKACKSNPNKKHTNRKKYFCKFCNLSISKIEKHEKTCKLNPDREEYYKKVKCKYCKCEFVSASIGTHQKRCKLNPNPEKINWKVKLCQFCNIEINSPLLLRHEKACKSNPNKKHTKNYKGVI